LDVKTVNWVSILIRHKMWNMWIMTGHKLYAAILRSLIETDVAAF